MKILKSLYIAAALIVIIHPASASTDSELAEMKSSMLNMLARIESLEAENKALKTEAPVETSRKKATQVKTNWTDRIAIKGDLRYRYEGFDVDGKADRSRNRVRGRLQAKAQASDDVTVTIGLATGSDDPVSTNQTLGGGASTKGVQLDFAYFKWDINEDWAMLGGKYKNNFYKPNGSELLFDGDYNPEGFALSWSADVMFVNAGYQWLESDSNSNNDMGLIGLQGGFKSNLAGGKFTAGLGFYNIDTAGLEVFYGDPDDFFRNSFACANAATLTACEYIEDYDMTQVFSHWSGKSGDLPVTIFAEYINNRAANDLDTAWAVGASIGKASAWKTWQMDYRYQDIEEDAVFGLITGSDFGGGGTGHTGHIFKGSFGINKGWKLALTYFVNENNVIGGSDRDFNRIQIDSQFKF
jgi:hypothetical protein